MGDGTYKVEPLVFTEDAVEQFKQDVLASQCLAASRFGQSELRSISSRIATTCASLERTLKAYADSHQGDAAQATQAHIARAVIPGLQQMDKWYALAETMTSQTVSFSRVHHELRAAEESNWGNLFGLLSDTRETAVVRGEYANGTSVTVTGGLPVFDPASTEMADSRAYGGGAGSGVGGSAGAGLGGVGAGLSPASAAPMPTRLPAHRVGPVSQVGAAGSGLRVSVRVVRAGRPARA